MCFSAEASFGAAVVITTIGVASYKKAKGTPYWALSIVPLFFGIQQLFEGLVWVSVMDERLALLLRISTLAFICFAWFIWPVFIPFSLWRAENHRVRKRILLGLIGVGAVMATSLMIVLVNYGVTPIVKDCSIIYKTDLTHPLANVGAVLYLSAVVLSSFVSSNKRIWALGVLNFFGFAVARIYYHEQQISIWCFFAAIFSVGVYWIVTEAKKTKASHKQLAHH